MIGSSRTKGVVLVGSVIILILAGLGLLRPTLVVAAVVGAALTGGSLLYASTSVRQRVRRILSYLEGR